MKMTRSVTIQQELNELKSNLANHVPENIYGLPSGYFDSLVPQVLARIRAMEAGPASEELSHLSSLLSSLKKEMPYSVPEGYFEGLKEKMILPAYESNRIQTAKEEIDSLSPLLGGLEKEMPHHVPAGYFENLVTGKRIAEKKPETKVVSLTHRKWFRYAAAALVTGFIALAGLLFLNKGEEEAGGRALSKVTHDIRKLNDIQKDNLLDFLDAGMNGKETAQANNNSKSKEVQELLKGVSDEELRDFQEQSEDVQEVLMTN